MNKKSIFAIGILALMLISTVAPFMGLSYLNNQTNTQEETIEYVEESIIYVEPEVMCSDVPTYEIETEENYFVQAQQDYEELMSELNDCQNLEQWWQDYKDLINMYSEHLDQPETIYDYFTEDEIYLIARCVETETCGADFESKTHVASVIFNRIEHESFPDDVESVIKAPGQFAYHKKNIAEDTYEAIRFAFEIMDTAQGALYFHSNPKTKTFSGREWIFTDYAGHHFY